MSGSDIDSVNTILSDKVFGFDDIIVNSAAYRRAMRFEKNAESGSNNTVETFAGRPPTVPGSRSKIEKMLVLNALRPSVRFQILPIRSQVVTFLSNLMY